MYVILLWTLAAIAPGVLHQSSWPDGARAQLESLEAELRVQPERRTGVVVVGNPGQSLQGSPPCVAESSICEVIAVADCIRLP
jgi:hypothetical protein